MHTRVVTEEAPGNRSRPANSRTTRWSRPSQLLLLTLVGLLSGCASSSELAEQREIIGRQIHEVDSLQTLNRQLFEELGVLRDSLQFIDDIETGQYYRDMRVLEDRIRQLEFALRQQQTGITVAELPADELFAPASADLSASGTALLDSVASVIARAFPDHLIRVEGHADSSPLGPSLVEKYGSNWGLSTARAASAVLYLIENRGLEPSRIAAVGFGSARPIASNESAAGRRQNRRVRVAAIPTGAPQSEAAADPEP